MYRSAKLVAICGLALCGAVYAQDDQATQQNAAPAQDNGATDQNGAGGNTQPAAPAAGGTETPANPEAPAAGSESNTSGAAEAAPGGETAPAGGETTEPAPSGEQAPASAEAMSGVRDIDYLSAMGHYLFADDKHGPEVHNGGGGMGIYGRHFANHWGWEAVFGYDNIETGPNGGGDLYRYTLGGDLVYNFGDRQHFTPYILLGGGGDFNDEHPRTNNGASGYADAGLGFVTGTFWHNRIRLRAEGRYLHDFMSTETHTGFNDVRAGIGIEIPFYVSREVVAPPIPPEKVKMVEIPWGLRDDDGDGVINEKDKCPNTPPNTRVDGDGCPIPKVVRLDGVTFEFNKTRLRPDAQTILKWVVDIMKKYPDMNVEIAGYTDSIGSDAYNLKLSQRRAEAVRDYLVSQGIESSRVTPKGYGKADPVASNATAEGRERNRRVELHILN
ncbi:MAG: OmpA family protein [Mycobacterium sp.]|uniref:OmpA family protein n=1 Tax=Mycobacterium sp. TaxID=1785 RepID=UPI002615391F|nr:OmpA family protein [Mycobacterium sp.]MDI3316001.1 OmpA family protein [Mycobacterium sp.]